METIHRKFIVFFRGRTYRVIKKSEVYNKHFILCLCILLCFVPYSASVETVRLKISVGGF